MNKPDETRISYSGRVLPGKPYPLGATYDGKGVNFALFSENATGVRLCLFKYPEDLQEYMHVDFDEVTDYVWHAYLPGIKPGQLNGYRIFGRYQPKKGFRFNSQKLLIDPYAKSIYGRVDVRNNMFDYEINKEGERIRLKKGGEDSAADIKKSVVIDTSFDWEGVVKPDISMHNSIIYELHVKGFTARHPGIPEAERGSYKALANPQIINYFKELGITAIELMPIHHFVHNKFLLDKGLSNYWGYNSIGYFAPHAEYSASGVRGEQVTEFKEMVKAYHQAGIEVILDVVYNHTAEGNHLGPTLAFRGIDNHHYYRLERKKPLYYTDYTGTGNTLNMLSSRTLQLVMDSLRYWATEMQVDGFRFDLASTLARGLYDVGKLSTFLDTIHQDPIISQLKLIAEPWDLGEGGYQVGNFPVLWAEWNGKFRDSVRKFWRGDESQVSELAYRLSGSSDLYKDNGKLPSSSINFVTAHDGFTLHDLVSYNKKHNEDNQEDSRDGEDHNISWNSGVEGPTDDPEINKLREKRKRNFLSTLLLSQGVPMISHGDEYGRTQNGNNNAYCQDNEIAWMDWDWDEKQKNLFEFTKKIISIRNEHPILHPRRYFKNRSIQGEGVFDIRWLNTDGIDMSQEEWDTSFIRAMGMLLNGELMKEVDEFGNSLKEEILLILVNSYWEPITFTLPHEGLAPNWEILADTEKENTDYPFLTVQNVYEIQARSLVLLKNLL
ncbi:glycogen debranching protein GlgX [Maribellus maritimus]|uniref:glycogen debranching protein GlgX n=1 Tax=Maribellus maritimus TaxID=2870838 RepID=UPI001EEA60A7|nr:glycogen debranching protein GlgX [Maribellus maritimus]MCG6188886.1 glycogen debranching protein GlgX [Maribellus maritimus]